MRKIISLFLFLSILFVMLLSLTSCDDSLAPFEIPENGLSDGKNYEITFWAKNDTNIDQVNVYKKAIADFERLYPNIKVNLKLYTDYSRIYQDVITNISTGTTPNVCITYPDHIATYMTGENVIVPLGDLMTDEKYGLGGSELRFDGPSKDKIVEKFLDEGVIDGEQYALPFMRSTEAIYINKTYVEALGYTIPDILTWDFMFEVAEAAMEKDEDGNFKVNGQNVLIPIIYKSTDNMMISMLEQLGAPYSTAEGDILAFNDTTTDLLLEIYEHAYTRSFSTFKISSYPANFLNRGQCIFAIDSTAGASWMGSDAPNLDIKEESLVQFETVVRPIPQFDTENVKMISQGPSICVFNKQDSGEVLASWLFAQFLLTKDVQTGYAKTEGYLPVTHDTLDSDEYRGYLSRRGEDNNEHYWVKIAATELLLDNIDNTFVTEVFNGSASLRNAAGQLIEEVTKMARKGEDIDEEKTLNLYDSMKSLYRLGGSGTNDSGLPGGHVNGPWPIGSIVLLVSLASIWLLMGIYYAIIRIKEHKRMKKS